jgi:uncharacterized membrane protein
MIHNWEITKWLRKIFNVRRICSRITSSIRSNRIFYLIVLVYIIVMSTITIWKNHAFLTSGFDLGLVNQAFHTTLFEGKLFYETADLSFNPGGSFFGVHFSPIFFLLLPFYAIWPSVENLLVMQTVIIALGAVPIYWMSRDKLGKNVGLIISVIYFIYPPIFLLNLNDIHLEPFTATFFIFSVYYLEKEEWRKFVLFSVLAMLTLEFAPIIAVFVAFYGLLLVFTKKIKNKRSAQKHIAVVILVSILIFAVAFKSKELFNTYTSPLPSPFHHILSDPAGVVDVFFNDWGAKMFYAIDLLAPLAFLPLLAPEPLIMAAPWIFASFVTNYQPYYSVYYQYTGFVIPFILLALPKAIERLRLQQTRRILYVIFLSTLIVASYLPTVQESPWNYKLPVTSEHIELIQKVLPLIPSNASVLTQNDIFPHVSNRAEAYMYVPNSSDITTDYILVDIDSPWYDWKQPEQFGERIPPEANTQRGLESGDYGIFASAKSILLLKKGYTGEPTLFIPFDAKYDYETLALSSGVGTIIEDPTSTSKLVLSHDSEKDQGGTLWYGPYANLLPGLYKVTYAMKVNNEKIRQDDQILEVDVSASAGQDPLTKKVVNGSSVLFAGQWFNFTLYFAVRVPIRGVEFRGFIWGNNSVCLDYVRVEQLVAQSISENVFYSGDLSIDQGIVSDGVITHVKEGIMTHVKGSGMFWHGPYVALPKGNYIARYWLRLDKAYDGTLIDIDVATNAGLNVLKFLTLSGSNFEKIGEWQSFDIEFTLQNDTNTVEFRGINVKELAPISFLAVELYQNTSSSQQPISNAAFYSKDMSIDQGIVVKNGTLWHGPYATLPKGEYIARYWLRLDEAYNGTLLDIEVTTRAGTRVLTSLTVHSSNFERTSKWQSFEVKFTLQNDVNIVEFRGVNVRELAPISLLAVEVYNFSSSLAPLIYKTTFNYKDLSRDQGTVANGIMTHVNGSGMFWHGPYVALPKDNYIAKYWLKLDEAYNGTLLDIDVSADPLKKALASLTLHGANFEKVDEWQSFEVKFTLQNDVNIVEFRGVNVRELAPISLLSIEIYPDTGQPPQLIYRTSFYSDDLVIEQGIIANGIMTHVKGSGTFWHGPYVALSKGNYIAKYWLKLDEAYNGTLLDIDVAVNGGKQLTFLTLSGSNFAKVNEWQSFEVKFTLQNDTNIVEFRGVYVRDTAPISLQSIEVHPYTGG